MAVVESIKFAELEVDENEDTSVTITLDTAPPAGETVNVTLVWKETTFGSPQNMPNTLLTLGNGDPIPKPHVISMTTKTEEILLKTGTIGADLERSIEVAANPNGENKRDVLFITKQQGESPVEFKNAADKQTFFTNLTQYINDLPNTQPTTSKQQPISIVAISDNDRLSTRDTLTVVIQLDKELPGDTELQYAVKLNYDVHEGDGFNIEENNDFFRAEPKTPNLVMVKGETRHLSFQPKPLTGEFAVTFRAILRIKLVGDGYNYEKYFYDSIVVQLSR